MNGVLSTKGEQLIESFEQLRLAAYLDDKGVPTIGWGHTGPDVAMGMTCTAEQADAWKMHDLQTAINGVNHSITECTQNQFDALVSFTYNVGVGAEAHSTMVRLMNAGDVADAAAEFPKWDHINGVENAGLKRRRLAEQTLFLS